MIRTKKIQKLVSLFVLATFLLQPTAALCESIDDGYSSISPALGAGGGEYVHGQKQGKILIRVLMFGAVPQQGIHYVPEGTDLLFSILYAGGYTESTKLNGITIRRRNVKHLLEVDLEDTIEQGKSIIRMQDGDVVTIPYNWRRDIGTISLITGFVGSMTAFTLSIIALVRQ